MNLNDNVWVRLTEFGKQALLKKWNRYQKLSLIKVREFHEFRAPFYRFQLWDLMHTFGEYLYNGCPDTCVVNNEIYLVDPAQAPK